MRHKQSTLRATDVHAHARRLLLGELDLSAYRPTLPAPLVVSLLLLASVWQASLSAACDLVKDKPCRERARQAALALLPRRANDLLARLLATLRRTIPEHLTRLPQVLALDLHQRPFYGNKKGRKARGTTKRRKKAGTRHSFTYATSAALTRWGRFTVGLLPARPHMRLSTVVGRLLDQAEEAGLCVCYLMLDKEFYAAEVIDLLQRRQVAFLMPAVKTGRAGATGNAHLFDPALAVGWYDYAWTADLRRTDFAAKKQRKRGKLTVAVRMCVARLPRGDGRQEAVAYATWGLGKGWSPQQVVRAYRRRFGIEASYRQLNGCLARTSSRNERYRLLLVGLALLLCDLWSWLHSEVFSTGALCETELHLRGMRLLPLCAAVAAEIASLFGGYKREWVTQRPVPPGFAHDS
jgi:putative transposase